MRSTPDYRSPAFLLTHIEETMAFYHPRAIDPKGGFFNFFANDGTVLDRSTRSLVSTCRFVFIEAQAYRLFGRAEHRDAARHGLDFLTAHHRVAPTRGYRWELQFDGGRSGEDARNVTYGLSFVVLAHAMALKAGLSEAAFWLDEIVATMEARIFEPEHQLYADIASGDWTEIQSYRGQNCNMHACEAMLAAFEATGRGWFLDRAEAIAKAVTVSLAGQGGLGQVWEHYDADWTPDWTWNKDDHSDGYRPWGYLSGHQTEWAKLLLMLDRHRQASWHVERAKTLFDEAMEISWDQARGGMFYSYGPDRAIYDSSKQQWVHAETLAAAAHLASATGEARYWEWYDRLWDYVWRNLVDHQHGAWIRALDADNRPATSEKSAPEPDYHNMGACAEILSLLAPQPGGTPS